MACASFTSFSTSSRGLRLPASASACIAAARFSHASPLATFCRRRSSNARSWSVTWSSSTGGGTAGGAAASDSASVVGAFFPPPPPFFPFLPPFAVGAGGSGAFSGVLTPSMMAAPAATIARISSREIGSGLPAATSLAGSAHSLTRMRSLSAARSVTGHTVMDSPSSRSDRSRSSFAFCSSALMVTSTHCFARSQAASRSSTRGHWHGRSNPSSKRASASSISAAGTRSISVCALVDHAWVSSTAESTESRSLG
mmetsp:Transcript_2662/g.11353  ORF Transcript_2662/g.11353 Transcript_2662/m.11353 type:complete len:255 (-) Transcript_2662:3451-4215(-)